MLWRQEELLAPSFVSGLLGFVSLVHERSRLDQISCESILASPSVISIGVGSQFTM